MKLNETSGQTIERLAKRVEFLENGIKNVMLYGIDKNNVVLETNDDHLFNLWTVVDAMHDKIDKLEAGHKKICPILYPSRINDRG